MFPPGGHVHPAPDIAARIKPVVTVSVTVTVPEVTPAPGWFDTVIVYAPVCPRAKLPLWAEETVSAGAVPEPTENAALPEPITCPFPMTATEVTYADRIAALGSNARYHPPSIPHFRRSDDLCPSLRCLGEYTKLPPAPGPAPRFNPNPVSLPRMACNYTILVQ
jgi:hypothetical protein